jgi:hypothetical protein
MTILHGKKNGSLKTFTVTPTPNETLLTTPINLPTSAPTSGDGVVTMTIQASDLPVISPSPYSTKYVAFLIVAGKNTNAAATTINYSVYKTPSGGSQSSVILNQTQTSVATNVFWSQTHYRFYDVNVGDTLEVRLWASVTGVNLDYYSLLILPSRMELTKSDCVKDLNLTVSDSLPLYTKGTIGGGSIQGIMVYVNSGNLNNVNISGSTIIPFLGINSSASYFSGRLFFGDNQQSTNSSTHATNRPVITRNSYFSKITFREVR